MKNDIHFSVCNNLNQLTCVRLLRQLNEKSAVAQDSKPTVSTHNLSSKR